MAKRGASKHCSWGKCNSDSRYPDRLTEGTFFIRFPRPKKITDNMTEWEKNQAKLKTEKAKRWQYLCGRADFTKLEQIHKDTYICSLHFAEGVDPRTDLNAEPFLATLTPEEHEKRQARKRKPPTPRDTTQSQTKSKRERLKKFRLISRIIPLNLCHVASQMVYVCCCLVNFQPSLCK